MYFTLRVFVEYPDGFHKLKDKRSAESESMRLKIMHFQPFSYK